MASMKTRISELIKSATSGDSGQLTSNQGLDEYIEKLVSLAEIVAWSSGEEIQGVVAFYSNDPDGKNAFITLVAVTPERRREKLAESMLVAVLSNLSKRKFLRCRLQVGKLNCPAIQLYRSLGFREVGDDGSVYDMEITLPFSSPTASLGQTTLR